MGGICIVGNPDGWGGELARAALALGVETALIGASGTGVEVPPGIAAFLPEQPGADPSLLCDHISLNADVIRDADALLLSLDLPMVCVNHAAALARQSGVRAVLHPAPEAVVPAAVLALCDCVTPDLPALRTLTGIPVQSIDDCARAARVLVQLGARAVVLRRGAQGVMISTTEGALLLPGCAGPAGDERRAGVSFSAGLTAGLMRELDLTDAVQLAQACAAMCGMQEGYPSMEQAWALVENG